jgi:hypothetical protein
LAADDTTALLSPAFLRRASGPLAAAIRSQILHRRNDADQAQTGRARLAMLTGVPLSLQAIGGLPALAVHRAASLY